ncbi:choline kinase/phosphohistidine swiveling domain-containing protein [Paenalcaligenes hominis]|uniref:Choline kinase/phosphohistidine swiveling domain-containing protein n=1 Tax=Paenalcaligenes hominis TaxID=643674 RepID=A0ABX0WT36_9BURK|nr:PEP/pyruvate-binding domain-containing protein [Paenalcaligenes hominis]NJB65929.1 choline kinase/phosphohistidine swiveling domain-containing protein [Paenalcaligenes hominis]GGE70788.1 hypothetical protein GCM10007278_18660 [Paenalcaligenes hominis]
MAIKEQFIILAAGKPHQGEQPSLLTQVKGQSLFEWLITTAAPTIQPQIVIGYAADYFAQLASRTTLCFNPKWQCSGSGYSLLSANLSGEAVLVSYADILYRPNLVKQFQQSNTDITLAYDSHWKQRFADRKKEDLINAEKVIVSNQQLLRTGQQLPLDWASGEFIGLVRFQGTALTTLQALQDNPPCFLESLSLSELVEWLRTQGCSTTAIDVQGDWAELNEPKDLAHFILGTKAETLARLRHMVKYSLVLDLIAFTVADWRSKPEALLALIHQQFAKQPLVVRSSAKSEDAFTHSNAGAYTSVLSVCSEKELKQAIATVICSYTDCQDDDQVLIQPMLKAVQLSGVAFTRTLDQGAPFYVINYEETGCTTGITSGSSILHKSLIFRKDATLEDIPDPALSPLILAIQEVEQLLNYDSLDIEFALDHAGQVYLLQVRPITVTENTTPEAINSKILDYQTRAQQYWLDLQPPASQLKGNKALFGVMPDWNPAEIIGTNPSQLAISLYQHLILNDVWAQQRAEYGYKDVRPQPLLRIFAGKPYIDIRASFNSFIPNNLPQNLTEQLVNFYLDWLSAHPHLHDKIEFDVLPTCIGPKFSKWEHRLATKANISSENIKLLKRSLLKITQQALRRNSADLAHLQLLEQKRLLTLNSSLPTAEKICILLEDCKRYGTLPFAHLARSGFVAVTLLKEGVEAQWLSTEARDGFMETLQTVSYELSLDAWLVAKNEKSWSDFVEKYGHLRPGTYDITSPAYNEQPELFLRPLIDRASKPKPVSEKSKQWQQEKSFFFQQLRTLGLEAPDEQFELFLREAIEGREKSKFIFTRNLSTALSLLGQEGKRYNLSLDDLANLPLTEIIEAFRSQRPIKFITNKLKEASQQFKEERQISLACQLPPLLCKETDFNAFILTAEKPNYIGSKRIIAVAAHIKSNEKKINIDGCIVLIPQADPGYDWLFGQKIAGLITMYGGANSHMAIRSAEFGLPAAIGVGEQLYKSFARATTLELDPAGETIRVLN